MATCNACKNEYDNTFKVIKDNKEYEFDCFECAIHLLAPCCEHCGCKIIGHGIQAKNLYYCCANCLRNEGNDKAVDRIV